MMTFRQFHVEEELPRLLNKRIDDLLHTYADQIASMIRTAVADEREACAQIAENHLLWVHQDECYEEIAAAIRARA